MKETIYETIHRPSYDYPYIELGYHYKTYAEHFHEEVEVLYVYKGEIIVTMDSYNEVLKEGDICLIMPNQTHTLIPTVYNEMCIMKIPSIINLQSVRIEKKIFRNEDPDYGFLKKSIDEIIMEHNNKDIGYKLAITNICNMILLNILRTFNHTKKNKNKHMFIEIVNEYLEQNLSKKISLEGISESCGYTKSYFSRHFKEVMNVNFNEYCITFKLKRSIDLLKKTEDNIEQIALKCGFLSVRSYNRIFKKYYNVSPGKYRKTVVK